MSNKSGKTAFLRSRGNAKSPVTITQATGRKAGQGLRTALYEIHDEVSQHAPVSPEEAKQFCKAQAKRCRANLFYAESRNDQRAVVNLQRKLALYEYLCNLTEVDQLRWESTKECPHCRVFAMTKGICSCCGAIDASVIKAGTIPEGVEIP